MKMREIGVAFGISPSRISRVVQSGLNKIKKELNNERSHAIKGFKDDVESGDYPNSDHTVDMLPGEKEALLERLDNF